MLSPERQSARMSKITNDGLTRSGAGCFIAVKVVRNPLMAERATKWDFTIVGYSSIVDHCVKFTYSGCGLCVVFPLSAFPLFVATGASQKHTHVTCTVDYDMISDSWTCTVELRWPCRTKIKIQRKN